MAYKRNTLIIRNLYEFIKEKIESEGYEIGDESGKMGIFDSFPTVEFNLPAISIDFVMSNPAIEADLGYSAKRRYLAVIDIFARDKFERDNLVSILVEALEKNAIPLNDYNQGTPSKIALMQFENIEGSTVRIVSIGQEQENRGKISFTISITSE